MKAFDLFVYPLWTISLNIYPLLESFVTFNHPYFLFIEMLIIIILKKFLYGIQKNTKKSTKLRGIWKLAIKFVLI